MSVVLDDVELDEIEKQSNKAMKEVREMLEKYQNQKPPSDPDELVTYLIKRLEAAEKSIEV